MTPRRERLAEALACCTDRDADWWGDKLSFEHARLACDATHAWSVQPTHGTTSSRRAWQITDAREAWEILASRSLIPLEWVDDPRRRFHAHERHTITPAAYDPDALVGPPTRVVRLEAASAPAPNPYVYTRRPDDTLELVRDVLLPHPPTVADCVAFASDVPGILSAEQIARQLTGRERVVWRIASPREGRWWPPAYNHTRSDGLDDPCPECRAQTDLLALGYTLDRVDADAVTLLCPGLGGDDRG